MIFSAILVLSIISEIFSKEIHLTIQEELPNGSLVGDFKAYISTDHVNSLRMSNINPSVNEFFRIESCCLKVNKRIDREVVCSQHSKNQDCTLKLIVIYGEVQKPLFLAIYVTVTDINDNAPRFSESEVEHTVVENASPILSDLFLYQAEDPDRLDNGTITYQLQQDKDQQQGQNFRLHLTPDNVPKLVQLALLDYESKRLYTMELIAFDGGQPSQTGTLKIKIKVKDENDNAPIFEKSEYQETINEDIAVNSNILEVSATDSDLDENGRVTYHAAASSTAQQKLSGNYFHVRNHHGKGVVFVKNVIDIDVSPRINTFEFVISACDSGHPQLCSRAKVRIRVVDVNDFRPTITASYLSSNGRNTAASVIPENTINNYIAIVTVTDRDSDPGGLVECHLSNSKFELIQGMNDKDSRESYKSRESVSEQTIYHIKNIKEFDREEIEIVRFKMNCKDNPNLQKSPFVITQLTNEVNIIVYIEDVNDNTPEFNRNPYEFKIPENRPGSGEKMLRLGVIEASDKDVNTKFWYKLTVNPVQAFELEDNGELFLKRSFDREDMISNPIRIQIVVSDGKFNSSTNVNVHVLDENDLPPVFPYDNYRFQCVENEFSPSLGSVEATDGDSSEFGSVEYKIFPPTSLFSINIKTGLIRVTTRLDREEKDSYSFTIIAIDNPKNRGNRNTGSTTVTVVVQDLNDNYPKIIYPQPQKTIIIDPTSAVGYKVLSMKASDPDLQENGTLTYSIHKDGLGIFNINPRSGDIFLSRKLTMTENQVASHLILVVSDNGIPTPKSTTASVSIKIAVDSSVESPDFGADYSQGGIPQTDKSNRKTLIIIVIVALALIVTVIMTILIIIYQSRMPTQNQISRNHKRKQAEFNEIQIKNQHFPPSDGNAHFMTSEENFLVPVTNRYFQNSLSLMRQEDHKDGTSEKLHDSPHLEEYQQLMSTPTLMRIWHNNLGPFSDQAPKDRGTLQHLPSCTPSSGLNPSTTSNDSANDSHKPHFNEQCSSNNYLQSSFV